VIVRLWGTRGSLASSGPDTIGYGGNTSCVEVRGVGGGVLALDAGTGLRRLGMVIAPEIERVDILLTHLHMDHILGLGFFGPLFRPAGEVHVWGPPSTTLDLRARLGRYLSPPLFPVRIRDLEARVVFHDVPAEPFAIGNFRVWADPVIHPGPTVGYRIEERGAVVTYLPDHEPALGASRFLPRWTSGSDLAHGADLLIHDAQYSAAERASRVGWGHSSVDEAVDFAAATGARTLVLFHHDPAHDDATLERLSASAISQARRIGGAVTVVGGREGDRYEVASPASSSADSSASSSAPSSASSVGLGG
jgi:phosphoribosyl 1,2-cyclic phosphodiesterase